MRSRMARLILATAEGQQAIELRPINSLGRHPNNSIQLLDKIVSKEHCILEQRDGGVVLRDLGSLNGTYVNGERVRGEMMLRHDDEIALGSTRARFDDGHGPPLDFNAPLPHGGQVAPHLPPGAIQHPHVLAPGPAGGQGIPSPGAPVPTPWSQKGSAGSLPPSTHQQGVPPSVMHGGGGPMGGMGMPQRYGPPYGTGPMPGQAQGPGPGP